MNKQIPKIQSYPYRDDLTSMCMKTFRWGTEAIKIAILHKVKLQLQLTLFFCYISAKAKGCQTSSFTSKLKLKIEFMRYTISMNRLKICKQIIEIIVLSYLNWWCFRGIRNTIRIINILKILNLSFSYNKPFMIINKNH